MDQQQLLLMLLAMLNGKAGGQITDADMSRVLEPLLGVMTGTYNQRQQQGPDMASLSYQYRPTWESLANNEYYDENSIELQIASSIESGVPLMEIKKQIPQLLAKNGQPSGPNDSTTTELISFATKLDSELHDYNVQTRKAFAEKDKDTWWSKAGISDPSLKASTDEAMAPLLKKVAEMYAPIEKTKEQKSYETTQQKLKDLQLAKTRNTADLQGAARIKLDNSEVPYSAGGSPQMTDFLSSMGRQQTADYNSKNPLKILNAATGLSFLTGLTNTTGDYLSDLGKDVFQGPERKRKLEEKYIQGAGYEGRNDPTIREMEQFLVRQQAMSGTSGMGKKNIVPIRTDLVNRQREERALAVAAGLQERENKRAAKRLTPAQSDIMQRILSLAMAEKFKK